MVKKEVMRWAIVGFEIQRAEVEARIREIREMLTPSTPESQPPEQPSLRPTRHISPAGRRRIAAAQRKRWADQKRRRAIEEAVAAEAMRSQKKHRTVIPMLPATKQRGRPKKGR